ncbi:MAG: hypothetical protein FWD75_03230 [Propionibacteriaceae bacterium]|nr:hypothetical protein [Propionibacteriaceae bacterium]
MQEEYTWNDTTLDEAVQAVKEIRHAKTMATVIAKDHDVMFYSHGGDEWGAECLWCGWKADGVTGGSRSDFVRLKNREHAAYVALTTTKNIYSTEVV